MNRFPELRDPRGEPEPALLPLQPSSGDVPPSQSNLRELLGTFRRHWVTILLVAAAVGMPGLWWVRQDVATYHAKATIRLRDVQRQMTGGLAGIGVGDMARVDPVRSQIEVLTSRAVALEVLDSAPELRTRLVGIPQDFLSHLKLGPEVQTDSITFIFASTGVTATARSGAVTGGYGDTLGVGGVQFAVRSRPGAQGAILIGQVETAIDGLLGKLQVKPREQTDVVDVTYADTDPARAQRVVNRVVQVFQASNAATAQRESIRRREFLESQLRYHDSVLNAARVDLSLFRGRQRAYSTKLRLSTEQASLAQLQLQRENLAADRRIYRGLLDELQQQGTGPDERQIGAIMSAPGITSNPVVSELFGQVTRYQNARDSLTSGRFGRPETNPEVQQLDALIGSAKTRLAGAVGSHIEALDARIESLDQLRSQSASAFPELSVTEEEEARLEEQVEAARATVGQLRAEYEKARLAEAVEVGQVEIVSLAALPRRPIGVGPTRKLAFIGLLGVMLGLGAAMMQERLNTSVRRRGQVEKLFNLSELAVIPPVPVRRRSLQRRGGRGAPQLRAGTNGHGLQEHFGDGLVVASDVHSIAAEAYRLLRTNLLFSLPNGSPRSVLVTSPAPGDGKTTVAANLAVAFAHQQMRVLLIDADIRRGRVHDLFRQPREPGLTEILQGKATVEGVVHATPVSGLFMITTGRLPEAPSELLGGDAMRQLLDQVTRDFAVVVIDSPPVLAASDASVMASIADATIVVLRAGRTEETDMQTTLGQLTSVGGRVVGAVLNDPSAAVGATGGYYYYSEYYGKPS